jgi:hypothetical protein
LALQRFYSGLSTGRMSQISSSMDNWREKSFFFSLIAIVAFFPFSEAFVSIFTGLLLLQALVLRSWLHPSFKISHLKIALFPVSVFGVYLIGTFFTNDLSLAVYELKKTIFWVVVPMAIAISPKLPAKKIYTVLFVFILAVIVSSLVSLTRYLLHDYLNIEGFRSLSMISHIRFSFQVILSLIILSWFYFKPIPLAINKMVFLAAFIWLMIFLLLLKSLLGIIAFFCTLITGLIMFIVRLKNRKWQMAFIAALLVITFIPVYMVAKVVAGFYDFKEVDPDSVENITIAGNYYSHNFEEGSRENGHLIYIYICDDELRHEWNKRSDLKYDDLLNGYPLSSTLIRFLTSRGLRKDSAGISNLSEGEIKLIESGITNYKFADQHFSIYPRIYETVWELDNYFRTGDPNYKTVAQRLEYFKASLYIIRHNPIFGIGTGNWEIKYNEAYDLMESRLLKENRASSHNQYVNYLVKFGFAGTLWIIIAVLFPVISLNNRRNYIFILFLIAIAFANFGDANFETHMGLSFFTFFYSLFLLNSTEEMKKSLPG